MPVEETQNPLPLCPHIHLDGYAGDLAKIISMASQLISQRDCKYTPVYANLLLEQKGQPPTTKPDGSGGGL